MAGTAAVVSAVVGGVSAKNAHDARSDAKKEKAKLQAEADLAEKRRLAAIAPGNTKAGGRIAAEKALLTRRGGSGSRAKNTATESLG